LQEYKGRLSATPAAGFMAGDDEPICSGLNGPPGLHARPDFRECDEVRLPSCPYRLCKAPIFASDERDTDNSKTVGGPAKPGSLDHVGCRGSNTVGTGSQTLNPREQRYGGVVSRTAKIDQTERRRPTSRRRNTKPFKTFWC
jgi:hypothetical protein